MVLIPAGTFQMGIPETETRAEPANPIVHDDNAHMVHTVRIGQPFYLGKYDVTRGQYATFARTTGRGMKRPDFDQTDDHPVVYVSWDDAVAYVNWLRQRTGMSYRLPSEAEWEYAARAGTHTARYWGDTMDERCQWAQGANQTNNPDFRAPWIAPCNSKFKLTAPVGSFPPNGFGLFDMLGNVEQWVQDCYVKSYEAAPTDGSAFESPNCPSRVQRGGSYRAPPGMLRTGYRDSEDHNNQTVSSGFRVARPVSP